MLLTGLDRLLADAGRLAGRRYGLLAHAASLTAGCEPAHLALAASGVVAPAVLFGPEHGLHGAEQDMVPAAGGREPWTGVPVRSLYGESAESLRPEPGAFEGLDLLVVDLQDVGTRWYTYAATAVWAAEAALAAGCEVWVLDRPNPLGGEVVEGNLPAAGMESFVGAFRLPVRHGLTLGELVRLEAGRRGWADGAVGVWEVAGWLRGERWGDAARWRRPWPVPSPNMPSAATALVYPGTCLVEATEVSEGRGTARPFEQVGAPWVDPVGLAGRLGERGLPGVRFVPVYFRPQSHKHAGELCGGVALAVTDGDAFEPYRTGVELLAALRASSPGDFAWRRRPYEFEVDRPAIDLLTGGEECRRAVDSGDRAALEAWIGSWAADEAAFRDERRPALLYPEGADDGGGAGGDGDGGAGGDGDGGAA
jgi:uncharacterized protein YbbC (DUF1343 family)